MKLENYEVHLPSYSIGNTIYDKIGPVCESYGKTVLVIGGELALEAAYDKIRAAVDKTKLTIIGKELFGEDCTYKTVEALRKLPAYHEADMVFGVGGGKALDTVKCLCITDDKPVFTFPTIASNCAATTSVSIMYNDDGTFLKPHFFIRPAMHAFIDTEIIAKAPERYMWAGIGDTYAKYYEAMISSRDERLEHFTAVGVAVSEMCRKPLLEYGVKAFQDHQKGLCTYDVEQVVLAHRCHHGNCVYLPHKGLHSGLQQRTCPCGLLRADVLSGDRETPSSRGDRWLWCSPCTACGQTGRGV